VYSPWSDTANRELPGHTAFAAGDTLAVCRHCHIPAVSAHLGEAFGDKINELT